jgi:hypothetical protein
VSPPLPAVADSTDDPPAQIVAGFAVTPVGVVGSGFTVTVCGVLATEQSYSLVLVTRTVIEWVPIAKFAESGFAVPIGVPLSDH